MKFLQTILFTCSIFYFTGISGQSKIYTVANAHSHNDYEQANPFFEAYSEQFGSIEADIFLKNGHILVAHDSVELTEKRTLEGMYLLPLSNYIEKNGGYAYKDKNRNLQLLIDVKTDSINTLRQLIILLKKYPSIIHNKTIKIVITGNRPNAKLYASYPDFIWFDGNATNKYTKVELSKIALLSTSFEPYSKWKGLGILPISEEQKITALVKKAHAVNKQIRFWACPDIATAWKKMIQLQVDYINTDHIAGLSDFLRRRNDSLQLMPHNRIIKSAGNVLRFGDPKEENHALDLAILTSDGKVVIEDRYGILAMDAVSKKIINRWTFTDIPQYKNYMSTYSGIKSFIADGKTWVAWSVAERGGAKSAILFAEWNKNEFINFSELPIEKINPAANALPNDIEVTKENKETFIYVVLNGNNELLKIRWSDKTILWRTVTGVAPYGLAIANGHIYVSNWAGSIVKDSTKESAGTPWGLAYTNPITGATAMGTVSVINQITGAAIKEIEVGLHPNALKTSADEKFVYVSNGSSDAITVINTKNYSIAETIEVGLLKAKNSLQGSTPNALELNAADNILYVANGFDNAVAVINLGKHAASNGKGQTQISGYIPTEAYPCGIKIVANQLVITNLESDGANVIDDKKNARSIHNQLASVSIVPLPDKIALEKYTQEVAQLNFINRTDQFLLQPRDGIAPVPVPQRLGEPSVFKHVVYIIKENKTYDQVLGDMPVGKNDASLCIFGKKITPNIHALAKQFGWMDDYYASGKSSAEGHQWTDAGMVSDYVEKNVRAWFRSYPHRQEDALVYNKAGFIWNHALDHGKTVRIFGEACKTEYDTKLKWAAIYSKYKDGKQPDWYNSTTIARIRPIISPTYPDCDNIAFSDQQRADIFIQEWKKFEQSDSLPNLMILSLPNDHTAGTSPDFPTPNAMVADNDLAVGRIVDLISKSKFWDSTVIFITQDDSQSGWDHISAYRTIGLTVSAYSSGKLNTSNYNQTSMLRTIEQILGLPPMNIVDATARLMTDCFTTKKNSATYTFMPNNIPLNEPNKSLSSLQGKAKKYALQSQNEVFNEVDGGEDNAMNRILWFYAKGNAKYPKMVK